MNTILADQAKNYLQHHKTMTYTQFIVVGSEGYNSMYIKYDEREKDIVVNLHEVQLRKGFKEYITSMQELCPDREPKSFQEYCELLRMFCHKIAR